MPAVYTIDTFALKTNYIVGFNFAYNICSMSKTMATAMGMGTVAAQYSRHALVLNRTYNKKEDR